MAKPKSAAQIIAQAERERHERALITVFLQTGIRFETQAKLLAAYGFRYVWDFAIMPADSAEIVLAVEVQGGIWHVGGHNTGVGLLRDMAKQNTLLAKRGIPTMPVAPEHISDGTAVAWVHDFLRQRTNPK